MPTPITASAKATLKEVLTDVTIVLAGVATVGEGVLAALPSGSVTTTIQVALPVLVAFAAGLRKVIGK